MCTHVLLGPDCFVTVPTRLEVGHLIHQYAIHVYTSVFQRSSLIAQVALAYLASCLILLSISTF